MISQANRGKAFEELIEYANRQYRERGWAVIQKVATPWQIIRKGKKIVSAFPKEKSTVDFVGVSQGRPIAFDAKSTRVITRFDLNNIEAHQVAFLKRWHEQGGIAFILVEFTKLGEIYRVPIQALLRYWAKRETGGKKSIPYDDFLYQMPRVRQDRGVVLDYLKEVV